MGVKRAHVIGISASGQAAARLLLRHGWNVIASDRIERRQASEVVSELTAEGAIVFVGGHEIALEAEVDLAVLSPGIPLHAEVVKQLRERGIHIISELELGWRFCKGRIAAVTGSNGKTTTTALLGEMMSHSGHPSFTCGNIGLPLSEVADQTSPEALLSVEASSFQLMTTEDFKPDVAVLLNLSPDHLDWHGGFEEYAEAKARIWSNQGEDDWLVYCADDPAVVKLTRSARSGMFPFSLEERFEAGAFSTDGELIAALPDGSRFSFPRTELNLPGDHNVANALAALSAALLMGISPEAVREGIHGFKGYPHRLETVREKNGVIWINDSKATNVDAGLVALRAVKRPIILIAGGRAKGGGFRSLLKGPVERIKVAILMGEAAGEIRHDLEDEIKTYSAADMAEAVTMADEMAVPGDAVLLSPLCASFDMFRNYGDRGDVFRRLVMELPE